MSIEYPDWSRACEASHLYDKGRGAIVHCLDRRLWLHLLELTIERSHRHHAGVRDQINDIVLYRDAIIAR